MAGPTDAYRKLFEHSPDAILIMEGDRFVDCNPAAARMLRFPSKQALLDRYSGGTEEGTLSAHPAEMSPPTQSDGRGSFEKAEEILQLTFERGSHCFEWDHLRADGEVFTVEVMLNVLEREPTPIIHVVWREIGERKQREQQLRQAQRLEAVGRLAGGIAHDFNNLLVVILGHAERLNEELNAARMFELAERAGEISAAGNRAAALTRQLLTFSKGQPIKPRPTDLVQLFNGLGSLLGRLIGEHIDFELDLPPGPITVEVDPSQIEQLGVNLSANARDAMPSGGSLVVALSRCRHEHSSRLPRLPAGEYAVIRVSDTGEGMEQEQLDRAFDPFFTTKAPGSGSGLGLATVYAVAEQCGGGASIESTPGKGTSVRVLLPLSSARPVSTASRSEPSSSLNGDETILLAEDEKAVRKLIQNVLRQYGYHVISACDGAEAVELARKRETVIDLLITDVVMPRLSGIELAKQLQTMCPGLKMIFMSGYAQEGSFTTTPLGEEVEILEKPFSPDVLLAVVRKLLDRL
jgi:signal transduction histidine kinase/CheY-like chemotaxis protein